MTDAARQLADGFASHIEMWARRRQCEEATIRALRDVAAEVSLATSRGHVCYSLANPSLRPHLLASGLVGTPTATGACPLILDDADRLYLHRSFDDERRLARRLLRAAGHAAAPIDVSVRPVLRELFAFNAARLAGAVDWQMLAAALALRNRLVIISGGPGTGKTTTVVNLLACLLAQNPGARIALAAPTGKARARLIESVRQRAALMPQQIRALLPDKAVTVHRLLGARSDGTFVHHAGNQLPVDALVVDEASMLDLAQSTRLFEAVPDNAHIILLGDKDQLAAVESGAVFAELSVDPGLSATARGDLGAACGIVPERIVPPPALVPGVLHDAVVWLRDNFRFSADSGLGRLAADISGGRVGATIEGLRGSAGNGVTWLEDGSRSLAAATLASLAAGFGPFFEAVRRDPRDCAGITAAFARFRALCAVRDGPRGVVAINAVMTTHARTTLAGLLEDCGCDARSPWYPGRAVLVTRNDYAVDLMNGDVGITLPDEAGNLRVYFAAGDGSLRAIVPARMPAHETAFATTVHKAQGSEFEAVMLILPENVSQVVTRELFYTAVTRARERVIVCASEAVVQAAVEAPTRRISGLPARLREEASHSGRDILGIE